jgi:hypothetical protein
VLNSSFQLNNHPNRYQLINRLYEQLDIKEYFRKITYAITEVIEMKEINWIIKMLLVMSTLVASTGRAKWIVNEDNELGFRIFGLNFWYYKYASPLVCEYKYRIAEFREFGEVIKPIQPVIK